jgi:hypothetical protein
MKRPKPDNSPFTRVRVILDQIEVVDNRFNSVTEPNLIDAAIHERKSLMNMLQEVFITGRGGPSA